MSSKETGQEPISYRALLDENRALQDRVNSLSTRLAEAEELRRAISEGDLDALVIPGPEGEMIFTLDSADHAYRVLVETMNEGTATLASDGTILYCNRRFADLLRMPIQAVTGASIYRFIEPENLITFKALLKQEISSTEINLLAEGGTSLPVYLSISSLQAEGSPGAWCLVVTDLTEQKKNEEILESERLARSIIEQAAEAIIVCDISGRIIRFSRAVPKICKCDPTFQRFEDLIDIRHSEGPDAGKSVLPVSSALKGSVLLGVEAAFEHEDGQRLHLLLNSGPLKNDDGKIIGCVVTLTDITERKLMEEELKRHSELLDLVPVQVRDMDGRINLWNTGAEEMYGWTKEEALGKKSHELLKTESPMPLLAIMAELVENEHWKGELSHIRHDGSRISVSSNWILHRDSRGKPISILEVNNDITERKQMEEELRRSKDELELRVTERTSELQNAKQELELELDEHRKLEADLIRARDAAEAAAEAKAAFLANMSHELRTPMNAVIGFSSLLLDDDLTPDHRDCIERIKTGGEALLAIIGDILDISKAEKEKIVLEHQTFSLWTLVEESLDMVASHAEKKGLNLTHTISYGTPDAIIGDHGRLRQILVNLLANAVKFTDQGDVSVSISSKELGGKKHRVSFEVRDTGIGIPDEKFGMLFQPFTQLEHNLSRKRDGTGLGLAISKSLVELMGGKIWAESSPGMGSTFHFTIDAEAAQDKIAYPEREDVAAFENLAEKKPLAILVAEDNPSNQRVLVEMLKRMGYRPDAVADGKEVLQALEIRPYDLVLMDIKMPEMDGLEACQKIRKTWPENGPKVIAITAYALEGDREKCLEAGMDDYIAKPVKNNDLATLLRNITPPQNKIEKIKMVRGQDWPE
ncbi:MAG TPA: PAS domain S-box protein, partial [Methanotrichaceae archaeon]|nr:PAS domain S-box protein [Methanotrichaceae archaeon]